MKNSDRIREWLLGDESLYYDTMAVKSQSINDEQAAVEEELIKGSLDQKEKTFDTKHNREIRTVSVLYNILAAVFVIFIFVNLLMCVSYLPPLEESQKAVNNEVSQRYIEKGLKECGSTNIVAGMILDYRAFDTFGESNVLFIATVTVLILMRNNRKKEDGAVSDPDDRRLEPKDDIILQKAATFLVPVIVMFGIYVIMNGHLSPGGGFSGGAVIGAGLILYANAFGFHKTERFFTEKTYKWISFTALTFYCLAKSYSFFTGANHLESHIPLGKAGAILSAGLILPLNICVGLVVACTMYTFYCMFRKGDF
ncbi:MAG: hypothetical protein K6F84_06015 [Lachnospiraceae bacterium]|nr:hypothetical protein [Lachnospiraceae bacterium]